MALKNAVVISTGLNRFLKYRTYFGAKFGYETKIGTVATQLDFWTSSHIAPLGA
jgi:hypothetical protein